jgi:hypothetical protein
MTINKMSRRSISGLLLAACALTSVSNAQVVGRSASDGPRGNRIPVLQCCQCAGPDAPQGAAMALNTGSSLWSVTLPGSSTPQATAPSSNAAWTPSLGTLLPPAHWISPLGNPTTIGTYSYQTQFDARRCTIPSSITVSGQFLADNKGSIYVDGVFVKSSVGTANYGFLPGSLTSFSYTIPAGSSGGIHTVEMRADNTSDVTGVVVQLTIKRNCPRSIEMSNGGQIDEGSSANPK